MVCGAELTAPFFAADEMPASAQDIPDAESLADDRGVRLELCRCPVCGLVQFNCEAVDY